MHIKNYNAEKLRLLACKISDVAFIMLIHVKMPTVGILTLMSIICSFQLCIKSVITSRPGNATSTEHS